MGHRLLLHGRAEGSRRLFHSSGRRFPKEVSRPYSLVVMQRYLLAILVHLSCFICLSVSMLLGMFWPAIKSVSFAFWLPIKLIAVRKTEDLCVNIPASMAGVFHLNLKTFSVTVILLPQHSISLRTILC